MKNDPTLLYATSNRGNHFIRLNDINGVSHVYLISGSTSPTIEAHNYRRSNLNIKKIVDKKTFLNHYIRKKIKLS